MPVQVTQWNIVVPDKTDLVKLATNDLPVMANSIAGALGSAMDTARQAAGQDTDAKLAAFRVNVDAITQGPPGPANSLTVGTVTTGAAGSAASATVTGAAPNQTLNLTLPRGATGNPSTNFVFGTGSPEGAVTASYADNVTYTDTSRVSGGGGATRYWKTTGTGNTGWFVIEGDTGWRNVTPSTLPSTITAGKVEIRRVDRQVFLRISGLVYAASQTAPLNIFPSGIALGSAGFAPGTAERTVFFASDSGVSDADAFCAYISGTTLYLRLLWRQTTAGTTTASSSNATGRFGSTTWLTGDAWPTALPGIGGQ